MKKLILILGLLFFLGCSEVNVTSSGSGGDGGQGGAGGNSTSQNSGEENK